MRQRIYKAMPFPYQTKMAEICAKCSGADLWRDGIRFARPSVVLWSC